MAVFCITSIEPSLKQRILQEAGLPQMSDRNLGTLIGTACIKLGIDKSLYEKYIDVIIPELNINSESKKQDKKAIKQAQLESKEKAWKELSDNLSRKITKSKNFKQDHTYYIEQNGKKVKVEKSITKINEELHKAKEYKGPKTPAAKIGNTFDSFVRDYFSEGRLKASYPNLSKSQQAALKKQIDTLVKQFDKKFGKGNYKVLTDELTVGGTLSVGGKDILTAGTVDMIIVTNDGWYLYDMKTTRKGITGETQEKYSGQVTAYKNFITAEAKASGINLGQFKGYGLVVAEVSYPTDNGSFANYDNLNDDTTDQVIYNGKPLQEDKGFSINIQPLDKVSIRQDDLMGSLYYEAIKSSNSIEEAAEEIKEKEEKEEPKDIEEDTEEQDIEDKVEELRAQKEAQIEAYAKDTLRPISAREELIIGKNAIKMAVYVANKIVTDARGEWEFNIFGTRGSKNILTVNQLLREKDALNTILNFIKENYFGDVDAVVGLTSEKAQFIYDNWQAIINRNYNTLLRIAKVGLTSDNSVEREISEEGDMLEAFQIGERELNDNESYDIDKKEIDFQESIPTELKSRFYTIPKPARDADGNIIRRANGKQQSVFQMGIIDFYDGEKVIQSIASLVHSCRRYSQMIRLLEENKEKYPYYEQVLEILQSDRTLKDKFFRTFRKNSTTYTNSRRRRGKMQQQTLNKTAKRNYMLQGLRDRLLSLDEAPEMFIRDKNNAIGVLSVNKQMLRTLINAQNGDRSRLIASVDSSIDGLRRLSNILSSLGIDTVDNINLLLGEDDIINTVKEALNGLYVELNRVSGNSTILGNTNVMKAYFTLISSLENAVGDRAENVQYADGKNYQTNTQPTFMQDTIEELAGKKVKLVNKGQEDERTEKLTTEEVLTDPNSRYVKYRQFSYLGPKGRVFVNSWLDKLLNSKRASGILQYWAGTSVNKRKLFKQTLSDYTFDTLVHYFAPDLFSSYRPGEIAAFRVPNYADKNADGYIPFEKEYPEEGETVEDAITKRAFEYFLYEITRMRAVLQQARDPKLEPKDVINFHINRKKAASFIAKIQNGEKITRADLVENGKLRGFVANSGLSFKFVSEINDALIDPTSKLGDAIIKFLNDTEYNPLSTQEAKTMRTEFKKLFKAKMEENERVSTATIKEVLGEKGLKSLNLDKDADEQLKEFFWQNWLAVNNIYNLMLGDLAYYKDTTDAQKRFAQVNAGTEKANVESQFVRPSSGKEEYVSDGKMRVVVVKTDMLDGKKFGEKIRKILNARADEISKKNKKAGEKLRSQIDGIVKIFKEIDVTDGQGFGTPTGFWKKMRMLGEMTPEFERAFARIRRGDFSVGDVNLCVETLKPFGYGFVEKAGNTVLGDELVPTQLKDSEAMLFLAGAILQHGGENGGPLAAIYKAIEDSHYSSDEHNLDTYVNNGIDVIVFDSAVKSGGYGVVDLNGLSYEQILERLKNLSADELREFPFDDWGKQQNTPAHMQDHEQAMSSQNRILSVADFVDGDIIDGKPAKVVIERYFKLINEDLREGIAKALDSLGCYIDGDGNLVKKPDFNRRLARKIREKAANDKRYSVQSVLALSIFDSKGELVIPFGDPAMTKAAMSTIFSAFKNKVNKESMLGGPAVLTTGYGLELKIKGLDDALDEKTDKDGVYYEAMIVAPTKEIERKITYNAKVAKAKGYKFNHTYKNGDIILMEDIDANHILRDEEKEFLLTFIPCEDKYSIVRCKIKEFLPRFAGEVQRVSKKITAITGKDFDIDKGYDEFFYDTEGLKNEIAKLEKSIKKEKNEKALSKLKKRKEKAEETLKTWKRKNKILRIKMQAVSSPQAIEKLVSTGEFVELTDLAEDLDPSFNTGLGSLAQFQNAMAMHKRNAAGKEYVGISALNNVSHAIANIANIAFKRPDWKFSINGTSVTELFEEDRFRVDLTYNMEGARISGILRQFVGASADNGKKPTLGSLNTNPITANMANGLLRMGFPLKTVIYMLNNPIIKEITKICEVEGGRFEQHLADFADTYLNGFTEEAFNQTDFTDEELRSRAKTGIFNEKAPNTTDISVLYFFQKMAPYCQAISDMNQFTSLNSLQNAAGPTEFDERVKYAKLMTIANESMEESSLWEDRTFFGKDIYGNVRYGKLFTAVPFLQPLFEIYERYIPEIADKVSPVYSEQFGDILGIMQQYGLDFSAIDMDFVKEMRKVVDAFELYQATKSFLKSDAKSRKEKIFDFPIKLNEKKSVVLKDNTLMQGINIGAMSKKSPIVSASSDVSMLSQEERDEMTAASADLMKSPANRDFMQEIAEYMFTRFGFSWKPKSTANLLSNDVKVSFGNDYREAFTPVSSDPYTTDNFLIQYARNNPDCFLWKSLDPKEDENLYTIKGKTLTLTHQTPIFGIKLGSQLYMLDIKLSKKEGENVYVETSQLGIPNQFMEYNALEDGAKMETVITQENIDKQAEKAKVSESAMAQIADEEDDYDGEDENEADSSAADMIKNGTKNISSQEEFTARNAIAETIRKNKAVSEMLAKKGVTQASLETPSVKKLQSLINIIEGTTSPKLSRVRDLAKNLKEKLEKYC